MARPETLFDDWPDPVLLVDPAGIVRRGNAPACQFLGYQSSELIGIAYRQLAPGSNRQRREWMRRMYSRGNRDLSFTTASDLICQRRNGDLVATFVTYETATINGENWTWVQLDEAEQSPVSSRMLNQSRDRLALEFLNWARDLSGNVEFNVLGSERIDSEIQVLGVAFNDAGSTPRRITECSLTRTVRNCCDLHAS